MATAKNEKRILIALFTTLAFVVVEVVGSLASNSLALMADAVHSFTDAAALLFAWWAFRISRRPADERRSFGYDRFQVLAAYTNGILLVVMIIGVGIEAIERLEGGHEIDAPIMIGVAVMGIIINAFNFWVLNNGDKENLNMQGAAAHVLGDMMISVGTIIAGIIIYYTAYTIIDPLLSIVVTILILLTAWRILKKSTHVLMEGTPNDFCYEEVKTELLENIDNLVEVTHMHVWQITNDRPILTMHIRVGDINHCEEVLVDARAWLANNHGIHHTTIQIELHGKDEHLEDHNCHFKNG